MRYGRIMVAKMKGRLPFIAALWTAIAVAMLSAMLPSGLPLTRVSGSAFDPATSLVVLKARSPGQQVAARASEPDEPAPPMAVMWMLPVALPPFAFKLALALRVPPYSGLAVSRPRPSERPRVRAPPGRQRQIA